VDQRFAKPAKTIAGLGSRLSPSSRRLKVASDIPPVFLQMRMHMRQARLHRAVGSM
jgi:hypothetical protein